MVYINQSQEGQKSRGEEIVFRDRWTETVEALIRQSQKNVSC